MRASSSTGVRPRLAAAAALLLAGGCGLENAAILNPPRNAGGPVTLTAVQTFDAVTGRGSRLGGGAGAPLGYVAAVAARGGTVFVVDPTAGGLVRLDAGMQGGRLLVRLADTDTVGLHVTPAMLVYVVDRMQRAVLEVDPSGSVRQAYADAAAVPAPVDVTTLGFTETLVIADELTGDLVSFGPLADTTGVLSAALSPVRLTNSVRALGAAGDTLYVLDDELREVMIFDRGGHMLATLGEGELARPVAMAVDACGRVYVADGHDQGLFVFRPDSMGAGERAPLAPDLHVAITDLWADGDRLYAAAGARGLTVFAVEPPCWR